jgi:hypothetical protein
VRPVSEVEDDAFSAGRRSAFSAPLVTWSWPSEIFDAAFMRALVYAIDQAEAAV